MAEFRLPRIPRKFQITDVKGACSDLFQQWWASVMKKIEAQEVIQDDLIADLAAAVAAAAAAQADADAAEAAAAAAQTTADGAALSTLTLTAGAGLTGGGNLTANRTFTVGAGTGITVNADDVALTLPTAAGVYTPTLTNTANLDASTAYECQYLRVGGTVSVWGKVSVDPTLAATATQLGISLPIASNFGAEEDCGGTAFATGIAGQGAGIRADAANDRAEMVWVSGDITNQPMYFSFGYQLL